MGITPNIRFKGFTDDWEQRKLSELLYLSSERNNGRYTRDDVLAASLGTELQKKHIYFGLRATDESVKNYKVVLPNDVIYTKSPIKGFPNGIIRTSKGENGIVPTLYCVYHSVDIINPSIIQAYFESKERLDAYLVPLVNIGARNNVNITDKEFLDGLICIPNDKAEQDKIVDVLERLSNLITLHQRKCDETKKLKKFMLQKMFPKKDEKKPEIRFAGFTDDWEQRKLSELGEIMTGSTPSTSKSEYYSEDGIPWVTPTDINALTIFDTPKKLSKEGMKVARIVPANTILCTCIASIGKNALLTVTGSFNQQINSLTPSMKNDAYFLLTESKFWSDKMKQMAASGTMQIVNKTAFSELKAMVPTLDEQKLIGSYFRILDDLITLHQRKCDEIKEIKKFMLQNMFPQKG